MSLVFYMYVHVPKAITAQLRLRSVKVITAQEDGADTLQDAELLDRARSLGCVLFTFDDDLLQEARSRQLSSLPFAGLVYSHLLRISIGTCVSNLELLAKAVESEELSNQVVFLPL